MIVSNSAIEKDRSFLSCQEEELSIEYVEWFGSPLRLPWPKIRKDDENSQREELYSVTETLRSVKPTYSDDINRMVSEAKSRPQSAIEIGKSFDIMSLLSCNGEMYDLQRKSGELVKVDERTFGDKYIMLCCFHVPIFLQDSDLLQALVDTCFELNTLRDDFEVVMVAKMNHLANYEAVFNHFFSGFPSSCLAVPFCDSKRRDYICKYVGLDDYFFHFLVVDVKRTVIYRGLPNFLMLFGADAFPFDEEHIQKVHAVDLPKWEAPLKLEGLVGGNSSVLLDKIGLEEKVSVSELNEKLVGLYLCHRGSLIPTLHKVYQQCRAQQLQLEIVLVYLPFKDCVDPLVYQLNVDTMLEQQKISWWRLPFSNSVSRRLWRLCHCYYDDRLIIVGPHGEFVDPYGGDVMSCYGIDAYPFTREALVQFELKKLRAVTLESLLVYGSRDYVYRGTDMVAVSELQGRDILVYVDWIVERALFDMLLTWYREIKAKDPEFEVVFVRLNNVDTIGEEDNLVPSEEVSSMPWLVCPFDPDHSASLEKQIFTKSGPTSTLIEFRKDGKICSFQAHHLLIAHGPDAFPFDDNLRQEIISDLSTYEFMEKFMEDME